MRLDPARTVLVLDLDDTIYAEYGYKLSGIGAVVDTVCRLYPGTDRAALMRQIRPESSTWLDDLCHACGFNGTEKQSLLWFYRLHRPDIAPAAPAGTLVALMKRFAAAALVSDGRSLTQRLKLEALGLLEHFDDILISEAGGGDKPDPQRFESLQKKYAASADTFVYMGDNIKKDFVAPNRMGWLTIGIRPSEKNIHRHDGAAYGAAHQPHLWLDSVCGIAALLDGEPEVK